MADAESGSCGSSPWQGLPLATCAVHEQAERDVVQPQRVPHGWLREEDILPTAVVVESIGRHAAACAGLSEEMVWAAEGWHCRVEFVEDTEVLGNRGLDRDLLR